MTEAPENITLLLVHDDIDEANRMVSLLRNAGYTVDPHYAADAKELSLRLQEHNWELVLAQFSAQTIPARNIIHLIRRSSKDIPVIFIIDDFDLGLMVEALKMGASDAVPQDQDQYFIQVASRTLANLEQRRKLRYWRRRFSESEDRLESLILSSQDGIAIVKEGMYVLVNDVYANFFRYPDADSLTLVPVFDTVAGASHKDFKQYLRPLDEQDAIDNEVINFEGVGADGGTTPVQAILSQIDFHGEPALQLLVKKRNLTGDTEVLPGQPVAAAENEDDVSKIRLRVMVEGINGAIRRSAKSGEDALIFYIKVDHYEQLQRDFGIGKTEEGIANLARFLDDIVPDKVLFGRIREEAFVTVINSADTEKAISFGKRIAEQVSSQIFKTSEGSFTCTLSIGITLVSEATASADEALSGCRKAVAELHERNAAGNGVRFHQPTFDFSTAKLSETDLLRIGRQIIKKNLYDLAFQPVVSLHGLEDEFYDVVMRIQKDALAGDLLPPDFIGNLFQTDAGRELDRTVIGEALKRLSAKKKEAPATRFHLHLSAATIEDEKFVSWLHRTLEDNRLSPADIVIQMREFDISRNVGKAADMQQRLHNMGAEVALSHFGLSINPLTILNKVKVDYVKLDKVLTEKANKEKTELANLKNLIAELKAGEQKVVVPFIESATIIPTLWQAGVDYIQGNYIQQPSAEMTFDFSEE